MLERAEGHARLCGELGGPPLQVGPWYNSSVAISHDGHIATVTMPVRGNKRSSDVTVRVSCGSGGGSGQPAGFRLAAAAEIRLPALPWCPLRQPAS